MNQKSKGLQKTIIFGLIVAAGFFYLQLIQSGSLKLYTSRIFSIDQTKTWKSSKEFLYRSDVHPKDNSPLLTNRIWKDFKLSLRLFNPHDCSILFNYQDNKNYYLINYKEESKTIKMSVFSNGVEKIIKSIPTNIEGVWPLTLEVKDKEAALYYDAQQIVQLSIPFHKGKIGLLINEDRMPKTLFSRIDIQGQGKFFHGPFLNFMLFPDMLGIFLIFGILSLLFVNLIGKAEQTERFKEERPMYAALCFTIGLLVFSRLTQVLVEFDWQSVALIKDFAISAGAYAIVLVLAYFYSKLFDMPSTHLLFLGFLFCFYVMSLVNWLTLRFPDTWFLSACLVILFLPVVLRFFKPTQENTLLKQKSLTFNDGLIFLWMLHSLFYFFEHNLSFARKPFGDEISFWQTAAQNIVQSNVLQSHLASYQVVGHHTFAIPFISAWPNLLFSNPDTSLNFYMPIVVIFSLWLFLNAIKRSNWLFLFFYVCLFGVFNFQSWIGALLYKLVYGEGISTIFFLFLVYEIIRITEDRNVRVRNVFILSFLIGLLSISKAPILYLSFVFFMVYFMLLQKQRNEVFSTHLILTNIIIFLIPLLIWQLFSSFYYLDKVYILKEFSNITFQFNDQPFREIADYIIAGDFTAVYYTVLSLLLIFLTFKSHEYLYLAPAVCLTLFVGFYYGFLFWGGEVESSTRYLMPQLLAVFYLGAMGFDRFMNRIYDGYWPYFYKSLFVVLIFIVLTLRLFIS